MAMLAEPRRKQRWTLNPRGKDWSNDSSKFGQRMLEKMGWTIGKGLGVNEQGITEHVKIKVKNDTVGVGFKNDQDKAWTEHQKAFDNFLSHLQKNQDPNVIKEIETQNSIGPVQSLELKSKQSRARVHYQKFTRGKDVKKYSAKDLADILGGTNVLNKVLPAVVSKEESNIEEQHKKDTDVSNIENITGGSFTINRGSITDYFKKKTAHFLQDKDTRNTPSKDASDSENEQYRGFGFVSKNSDMAKTTKSKLECKYTFDNLALDVHSTNDTIVIQENMKGLNKRKGEFFAENDVQNLDHKQNFAKKIKIETDLSSCKEGFTNMALDLDNQVIERHIKNKFEIPRVQLGLTNDALDLTDETCDKKRVTFNDHVEYSTDSVKKKKCTGKLDKFEVDSKKKRKKQKQIIKVDISNKIGFVNEALDTNSISDESRDNETNEYKSKKHRKQKQQRISNLETIQEIAEEVNINSGKETDNLDKNLVENISKEEHIYVEDIHIKKKKKKAKKHVTVACNTDDGIVSMQTDTEYTKKEEKNEKKGHKRTKMNDCLEIIEEIAEEQHQIVQTNITHVKSTETLKINKKKRDKDINKDLEHKLKSRKSKKVLNNDDLNDEEINTVAQENMTSEKHNTIDKSGISNEDVTVEAKIKNNIVGKETNTNNNKNDNNNIIIEKNLTDTEIRLQDVELTQIKHEESTSNSIGTIADSLKEKTKMSKRMLKSFFHLNYVSDFPGSNVNEIRGYGADLI